MDFFEERTGVILVAAKVELAGRGIAGRMDSVGEGVAGRGVDHGG